MQPIPRVPRTITDAEVEAAAEGKVVWVGKTGKVRQQVRLLAGAGELDAHGRVVMPGFVDSHTHPIFAGSREKEFAQRITGVSYQDIAAAGGVRLERCFSAPLMSERICSSVTS